MKKILAISLILTLCFALFACGDENNTDPTTTTQNSTTTTTQAVSGDVKYTYEIKDGKAIITGVKVTIAGDVAIPSELGGYPVTTIGQEAFANCTEITSVTIPDSVTEIGSGAFSGCSKLTSIVIPEGVERINWGTFVDCVSLTAITFPSTIKIIENGAFDYSDNIERINITDLSAWFETDFYWSDDNSWGNPLGYGTELYLNGNKVDFDGDLVIPDGTKRIGELALCGFEKITSVTIPDSVTEIGSLAFYGCNKLTEIAIPDSVTKIDSNAFMLCSALESVTIPSSVTSIGLGAFSQCENIKRVNITDIEAWKKIEFSISKNEFFIGESYSSNPLYFGGDLYLGGAKVDFSDEIVTATNYVYGFCFDDNHTFGIRMPQITGNTNTIKNLNKKIWTDTISDAADDHDLYTSSNDYYNEPYLYYFNKGETFDFDYVVKNNVLVIYVYSTVPEGSNLPGQSGDGLYRNSYYYDIANDKILSTSQAVEKLGLTIPDYADIDNMPLDNGGWLILLENNELTLELFI